MFYTIVARIFATLAALYGLYSMVTGFAIGSNWMGDPSAALGRYFGSHTAGEVIDRGFYLVVFAAGLGTLAEISTGIRRMRASSSTDRGL